MTDELSRVAAEPEETVLALLSEMHPSEADAVTASVGNTLENNGSGKVTTEAPPDWLKPMEEDEDEGAEVRSGERVTKKTNDDAQKVKRRRGRPPKARNARHGLTRMDLKKGLRVDRVMKKTVGSLLESKRPSFSSRGAPAAPTATHIPEVLPRRPQSLAHIPLSAPQRPRPVPDCPAGGSGLDFPSPPRLTRLSPLSIDTSGTRSFILSPSVKVGNVSPQILSAEPGKDGLEPPLRLWLCPSLEPISPVKTQDISEQSVSPPGFPEAVINGALPLKESLPLLSQCGNCGCPFSVQKPGDSLCFRCRPKLEKKHSPPNIVFRKVGQDQWEVGKTKDPRKQILAPRPKYKKIVKMVGQDQWEVEKSKHPRKQILDFVPDGGDEDEDEWASKKRNRRMCRRCVACLREDDCGKCDFCMDKPKFGGSNKKRQKCRLRQCKFQSKLHFRNKNGMPTSSLPRMRRNLKPKLKRRGRPPKKRKFRSHPWEEEEEVSDEDEGELRHYEMNGSKARARRPWGSFKEEDAMFVEAVIEDDDPSNMEDPVVLGSERSVMASNEIYTNASGLGAPGLFYNMSAMPVPSPMVGSVALSTNPPLPLGEVMSSLSAGDDISHNGFLQIEMVRVGSPPSLYTEEPQNTQAHTCEPQQEPTPVITQIFSLAGSEGECDRDQGLIELFTSLGQTVLPAHWVGVMAKGPVLQLLQCSKLSTMADTVVQIEKGFFYQVSVQNQPLLLMHAVYSRHPTCLETVDEVVSLLLDLENLGVCQGYQNLDMCSPWEPRMCVRAALCDLLISKDEEHCGKCSQPAEG